MKTIFIENGMPIIEDHDLTLSLRWINVRVASGERVLSDPELIKIIISRILQQDFEVTHHPRQRDVTFVASFPLVEARDSHEQQIATVVNLVKIYEEDILARHVIIDRDLLFGGRIRGPAQL